MATIVTADISALLDAVVNGDDASIIARTLDLLGPQKVPPAKIAARVGIPAAWGGGDGHPLSVLSVTGKVAEWVRAIPVTTEAGFDARRRLSAAAPLVQGFKAVTDRVRTGLAAETPAMPTPIAPADVQHPGGTLGALLESAAARDLARVQAILMGFYATGTDYRALLTAIYASLATKFAHNGHPLLFAAAGSRVLDMADWGDRAPAYIYWVSSFLLDDSIDSPVSEAAKSFAASPEHDLGWLRTRLSIPRENAAGAGFQSAVTNGTPVQACEAVMSALKDGATPKGIASGLALCAARKVVAVPAGDTSQLLGAAHTLQYVNAVHTVMRQTQNKEVWPLLYTAACAVNSIQVSGEPATIERGSKSPVSAVAGGLLPGTILRTIGQQMFEGDAATALSTSVRYLQMGHSRDALAGTICSIASSRDVVSVHGEQVHVLPAVAAAAEEYLNLPEALAEGGNNPLLSAAVRLTVEFGTEHVLADRIQAAIEQAVNN